MTLKPLGFILLFGAYLWTGALLETLGEIDNPHPTANKIGHYMVSSAFIFATATVAIVGLWIIFS